MNEINNNQPHNLHFFAASAFDWAQTTPERDLREVMYIMEKYNHSYNLYLVPVPHDTPYEINFYQPQVEGTQWLGYFEVNKKGNQVHCLKCDHVWDERESLYVCPQCGNTDKEQTVYLTEED